MRLDSLTYIVAIFIGASASSCHAAKILIVPLCGQSHVLSISVLGHEMARRGHEVHMMLPVTFQLPSSLASNESKIVIEQYGSTEEALNYVAFLDKIFGMVLENNAGTGDLLGYMTDYIDSEARQLLTGNDDLLLRLENIKFDIAIVDTMFFMKFQLLIPFRLRIPWVSYGDQLPFWEVRTPHFPSIVPSKLSSYTDKMSFFQRLTNIIYTLGPQLYAFPDPAQVDSFRKYGEFRQVNDLLSKSKLFLVTSDISLDYPAPMMPNVIQIGGISAAPASGRKLPDDLEKFMAAGKDGVILITFGSMATRLPKRMAEKFAAALEKFDRYNVIWRLTNKDNVVMPRNVRLVSWIPQNDILADPRVKLFITHSGNNGQFEALYHGVPMIGFPIFGDQHFNAQRLSRRGYGIPMQLHDFTTKDLEENIEKILKDDSYKRSISKASAIFRSARDTPAERAAYWIEHVIKFGGDHLRSAGSDLNFFQYFMIDAVLFVLSIFILLCVAVVTCLRAVGRHIFRKNEASHPHKNGHKKTN